ncbi:MAG: hypothetical protein DWQ47_04730 [Acidobacteria bacterium]|nr:MAG: hypothetical protein DWQ32_08280 [Acidobacteriota bacterium]REK01691.1 MAG: hypothetical protein DWQ38_04715 [Acidobacteriota bacterium]REK14647.1 MAG: hypothetical protein DWQ43_13970 [Acidobacteriota bacterium]REK45362.1 MAG: hypothetical protein DWQ47_04730 [Acidobacteriota bacterium]
MKKDELSRLLAVLGLEEGCSLEELKQAYKDHVAAWHPDRFPEGTARKLRAEEKLKEINDSYDQLKTYFESAARNPADETTSESESEESREPEDVGDDAETEVGETSGDSSQEPSHDWRIPTSWKVAAGMIGLLVVIYTIAFVSSYFREDQVEPEVATQSDSLADTTDPQHMIDPPSTDGSEEPSPSDTESMNFERLTRYEGEFPTVMLDGSPQLKNRIQRLLKGRFGLFMRNWDVSPEVRVDNGVVFAEGCRAHMCQDEISLLAIDTRSKTISVGLHSESELKGVVRTFKEDGGTVPRILYDRISSVRDQSSEFQDQLDVEAVVITENANLRRYPSNSSEVLEVLPRGFSVTVRQQKGQWFAVVIGNRISGWVHGNTIRFSERRY